MGAHTNGLFLLGFGIAKSAGFPEKDEITWRLISAATPAVLAGWGIARRGMPSDYAQSSGRDILGFLSYLKHQTERYTSVRIAQDVTYDQIYHFASNIVSRDCSTGEDRERFDRLLGEMQIVIGDDQILNKRAETTARLMTELVADYFRELPRTAKFPVFEEIADSSLFDRVDIFTLNFDLAVDAYLARESIQHVDGFSPPKNLIRHYHPRLFEATKGLFLYKLRGSINWFHIYEPSLQERRVVLVSDPHELQDTESGILLSSDTSPLIQLGNYSDVVRSQLAILCNMYDQCMRRLSQCSWMVAAGYEWNDEAMNNAIAAWLKSSGERRLLVSDDQVERRDNSMYAEEGMRQFSAHLENGYVVKLQKKLEHVNLEDLERATRACG